MAWRARKKEWVGAGWLKKRGGAQAPATLGPFSPGHNLALKQDGTVVAWGDNFYGQSSLPVGLSNVVAVGAGVYHSLALKRDGTVVAWGNNDYGQGVAPDNLGNVVAIS